MEDVQSVQLAQSFYYLHEDTPNLLLWNMSAFLLVFDDFVTEVALAGVFHDDAG